MMRRRRCWAILTAVAALGAVVAGPAHADTSPSPDGSAGRSPHPARRELLRIGTSAQGRRIVAARYGDPGGVPVLVAAAIHGDERSGQQLARAVRDAAKRRAIPDGIDLWVIVTANPDGIAAGTRQNAQGVDINRNFPVSWQPIACPSTYCAGPRAGSEPETRALMSFLLLARPTVAVWWHSTGAVVDAARSGVARPRVLYAYAEAVGYPVSAVRCGSTTVCTGNATQYGNSHIAGATHFVVELPTDGANLPPDVVQAHLRALWAAADAAR